MTGFCDVCYQCMEIELRITGLLDCDALEYTRV